MKWGGTAFGPPISNWRFIAAAALFFAAAAATASIGVLRLPRKVEITIDTRPPLRTMRGGIGASWHAIEKPILGRTVSGGPDRRQRVGRQSAR
ncbi:MAG TPA: hypothetical protein VFL57_13235 [Bryobacteraceae bacterium]|nr:hypothetical protein [Bryobacteraceae bacterium]